MVDDRPKPVVAKASAAANQSNGLRDCPPPFALSFEITLNIFHWPSETFSAKWITILVAALQQ